MTAGRVPRAGVVGWPVGHSLSPAMHRFWLAEHGLQGRYDPLPVPPAELPAAFARVRAGELRGFNVTIPHKVAALDLVDRVSDRAARAGAVNTVSSDEAGTLLGDSTDGFGFLASVAEAVPGFAAGLAPVCLLGAGGAARSIAAALLDAGAPEVRLVNRSPGRAEAIRALLGDRIAVLSWHEMRTAAAGAGLLVNSTSLGMTGQPPLDPAVLAALLQALPGDALVADIVYNPLETELLRAAGRRGHRAVDGLGMLLHQGRPGFAAWFGVMPAVTPALRAAVLDRLAARDGRGE